MEFLAKNLWHVFAVAHEENHDNDTDSIDMVNAHIRFINGLKDNPKYKCLDDVDKKKLLNEWESCDQGKATYEYNMLVVGPMGNKTADQYKKLCAAFNAGDKNTFDDAVKDGLTAILYK